MQYNMTDPSKDDVVIPSYILKIYPDFYLQNYTDDDWNVIRRYMLFCSMLYHLGIVFKNPVLITTYYKCVLIYNILCRYMYSSDPYTSIKNIITALFLFESFEIIFYKKIKTKIDMVLLYHHVVIIMIYIFEPNTDITNILTYGELSNIPLNIEYFLIKHKTNIIFAEEQMQYMINYVNHVNVGTYILIRVLFFSYFLIMYMDYNNYSTYYALIPLYIMGLIWSKRLFDKWLVQNIVDNRVD